MFDPKEYPVQWTFLSGREDPSDYHRNKPDAEQKDDVPTDQTDWIQKTPFHPEWNGANG